MQLKKIDVMINNKLQEQSRWRDIACRTTARVGGERVQSSGSKTRMADAIDRYVDLEKEIDECIDRLIDKRQEIIKTIEQLEPIEYDMLHKVYVQYRTIDEFAEMYNKTYSWGTTMHGRALESLQRILDRRDHDG